MRIEICYEDAIQYEWFLVKGAIEFPEKVPLTWSYNFDRPPLGHVTDIRREDDGAITGEMVFFRPSEPQAAALATEGEKIIEEGLENGYMFPSMYANQVTDERFENLRIVYKATLKAVVIIVNPAFPKIPEGVLNG